MIGILSTGFILIPAVSAQFQSGGVDHPGKWYVGEGLKPGDFFSYKLCHTDYKDCSEFQMDFWIEGTIKVGTEDKWLAQVVVYDGNKIVKGNMELGKIAPEPSGGSNELGVYRGAFKSSIVWLSAYATKNINEGDKGEKAFSAPSWGKIANIGGEQIIPTALEKVTVPAGTYDTVRIQFKTGGAESKVWVVDGFPFPIKASTWTQVSEGIPPQEYRFQLWDYKQNVISNPFTGITPTVKDPGAAEGCPKNYSLVDVKKTTKDFKYLVELRYGPPDPPSGCNIEWFINFKNKFDETEFLNQVQYDIFVVDDKLTLPPIRSIAKDEGRNFLFSPSGQVYTKTLVKEQAGTANYVIWVYGLAPEGIAPSTATDYLQIPVFIYGDDDSSTQKIPAWIKNNADWWSQGLISDDDFLKGIQFMVENGIIIV